MGMVCMFSPGQHRATRLVYDKNNSYFVPLNDLTGHATEDVPPGVR